MGGTGGIVQCGPYFADFVHVRASATYQCGIGAVHVMKMHASQQAGWGHSRKLQVFRSAPSPMAGTIAPQDTAPILQLVGKRMHIRATPRLYTIGGGRERGRREETLRRRSTSHQFQEKSPLGTPTTSGGVSSPATSGGLTAEPHSVRTSGARPVGRRIAARDIDNNRVLSHFI